MEAQKSQNCQWSFEENAQSRRHNPFRLQTIRQNYTYQNSVVLAQKQTSRSVEQNREPRNKPTHLRDNLSSTKEARIHSEKKIVFKWCWESWAVYVNQ